MWYAWMGIVLQTVFAGFLIFLLYRLIIPGWQYHYSMVTVLVITIPVSYTHLDVYKRQVYEGVELEDNVFCGPSCVFTNVTIPRAHYPVHGVYDKTLVKWGASIGANATIVCGHTVGRCALIAAGAVVTKDVKDHALMAGVPAKQIGWVCECGERLPDNLVCPKCGKKYKESNNGLKDIK